MLTLHGLTVVAFAFYLFLIVLLNSLKEARKDAEGPLSDAQLAVELVLALAVVFGLRFLLEGVSLVDATSIPGKIVDVLLLVGFVVISVAKCVVFCDKNPDLTIREKWSLGINLSWGFLFLALSILLK